MKGLQTSQAVAIFFVLIVGVFIYGFLTGGIPGVPQYNTKTVTISTRVNSGWACVNAWIAIDAVVTSPSICTPATYNPNADITVTATVGGQTTAITKVLSCCPPDNSCANSGSCAWGCGAERTQVSTLCLLPGSYTIKACWVSPTLIGIQCATKQVTV